MKIIFKDIQSGKTLESFNDPFLNNRIQDIIVKPNANCVKIVYPDSHIKEYYLESENLTSVHDIELDVKEIHWQFFVRDSLK